VFTQFFLSEMRCRGCGGRMPLMRRLVDVVLPLLAFDLVAILALRVAIGQAWIGSIWTLALACGIPAGIAYQTVLGYLNARRAPPAEGTPARALSSRARAAAGSIGVLVSMALFLAALLWLLPLWLQSVAARHARRPEPGRGMLVAVSHEPRETGLTAP
jgi:hypothetical protein